MSATSLMKEITGRLIKTINLGKFSQELFIVQTFFSSNLQQILKNVLYSPFEKQFDYFECPEIEWFVELGLYAKDWLSGVWKQSAISFSQVNCLFNFGQVRVLFSEFRTKRKTLFPILMQEHVHRDIKAEMHLFSEFSVYSNGHVLLQIRNRKSLDF